MKPVPFAYHRPGSIDEVLDLLAIHGGDAAVLAGGQSLVPLLNLRLARPAVVIDLAGLAALAGPADPADLAGPVLGADPADPGPGFGGAPTAGTVRLGPLVRQAAVLADPGLALALPLLSAALPHVGHVQTRSRGTVCGSLAHGDPLAELALAALVSGAAVELASAAAGGRTVPVAEFLDLAFAPRRRPDELVTALVVDRPPPGAGYAFVEVAHGATLGTAAVRVVPLDGVRWEVRLGVGLDRNRPLAATVVTDDPGAAAAALADQLVAASEPIDDRRGPAAYRCHLVRTLAVRATAQALTSAHPALEPARPALEPARPALEPARPAPPFADDRARPAARPPRVRPADTGSSPSSMESPPAPDPPRAGPAVPSGGEIGVAVTLDGRTHQGSCEPRTSLADFLRDTAGATSIRVGCEQGVCGSCTVLVDGAPARACLTLAASATGTDVVTATGLLGGDIAAAAIDPAPIDPAPIDPVAIDPAAMGVAARSLARALRERFALQCGFCAPGLVVTGAAWLAGLHQEPAPDRDGDPHGGPPGPTVNEAAIRQVLSGTICRCTGYDAMVRAILAVAEEPPVDHGREEPVTG